MSAGSFSLLKYVTTSGAVIPIRAQPETALLSLGGGVNVSGTGSQTPGFPIAKVSGSRRAYGVHARTVTVRFLTAPTSGGYAAGGLTRLPVFTQAVWDAYSIGNEGTYLGGTVRFVGKRPEIIK